MQFGHCFVFFDLCGIISRRQWDRSLFAASSCQWHFHPFLIIGHDQWQLTPAVSTVSEEHVCKDEWSAYCWDKSWGSCPVTCTSDEAYCYSYVYDSTGLWHALGPCLAALCDALLAYRPLSKKRLDASRNLCKYVGPLVAVLNRSFWSASNRRSELDSWNDTVLSQCNWRLPLWRLNWT